ncbi:MAG TPA: nucleoside phosphorylase [Candidatus Korarchaeota archaeon]|nr:nucleoside phosphorylase [Candidatus Korarchaeota archaeon]
MGIQPHIMCGPGDIAKYVLLPGDPKRAEKIAKFFDEYRLVAEYRQYVTFTGTYKGIPVSVTSTGIGCPAAAIAVEELAKIGAKCFIRVGTTGAMQPDIDIGNIIVATAAVRADGTTRAYVPPEYPAVASAEVVNSLLKAANNLDVEIRSGVILTGDAFYAEDQEAIKLWSSLGVLSVEMEASVIFVLSQIKGLKAGAILAVDGNLIKGTKKGEFKKGEKKGELDPRVQKAIELETRVALEAIRILEEGS